MLYRLQPDARGRALGCICSLSDKLRDRTLKVHSHSHKHAHTRTCIHVPSSNLLVSSSPLSLPLLASPCPDMCRSAFSTAEW